jgi:hypothetical protein
MKNKNNLLNNITLSDSRHLDCLKVQRLVEQRFFQWLISKNLSENEDLHDGLYDGQTCDVEVAIDPAHRKKNQRLLLEVEKAGEIARAAKREEQQRVRNLASKMLTQHMRAHMIEKLNEPRHVLTNLLRLPAGMSDLISLLYSPAANYQRIAGLVQTIQGLPKQLIDIVNNREFCDNIGREPRGIKEVLPAVGFIGIEGLKLILPIMTLKSRLRFNCEHYPLLGPKLWSYTITVANSTRQRLKDGGHQDGKELDGVVLGALSVMGMMAIHHQFPQSFEDVRVRCLEMLREQNNRVLYNAMLDATPDLGLLPELFLEKASSVNVMIARNMQWDKLVHVATALDEQHDDVIPTKRTMHGIAVKQGITYSQFDLLRRAKRFTCKEHVLPFLYGACLSQEEATRLLKQDLRKLDLREYIG